jgi:hypothetical protein
MIFIERPDCRADLRDPNACLDERAIGPAYAYLFGLYLGDGTLSRTHRRGVWKLRIFQDARYVRLIDRCGAAIHEVGGQTAGHLTRGGCTEISAYWKHWVCAFPQHGAGRKHERSMQLEPWQSRLVESDPEDFLAGLIHSDGCRAINRVKGRRYEYPRYFFTNHSDEIRYLFASTCALIGVECRPNSRYNISIAKRRSVAILDEFIGPKS